MNVFIHINAIFMYFYGGQLKQLYVANFLYVFNPFKMAVQFLFSKFDGPNAFFQNSTGPWPLLQKLRKIPECFITSTVWRTLNLLIAHTDDKEASDKNPRSVLLADLWWSVFRCLLVNSFVNSTLDEQQWRKICEEIICLHKKAENEYERRRRAFFFRLLCVATFAVLLLMGGAYLMWQVRSWDNIASLE